MNGAWRAVHSYSKAPREKRAHSASVLHPRIAHAARRSSTTTSGHRSAVSMSATTDFDPSHGTAADEDNDDAAQHSQMVIAAVWKSSTLGLAFMEGTTLRFCQVPDGAPEFRQLQAVKYQCKPNVFVIPSTSDASWTKALKTSVLQGGAGCEVEEEDDDGEREGDDDMMGLDAGDDLGANKSMADGAPEVVVLKNRDFSPQNAARRLSLLRTLADLPSAELKEQEMLLYLEHMLPREQDHACRAIAGLLAYLQRSGDATCAPPTVTCLRRYSLESQLYMAPECFLSLGVFADDSHPSAHGGRAKEGFSIWSLFCRTRSKPGERTLRSWFARPTQDLATLRVRTRGVSKLGPYWTSPCTRALLSPRAHDPALVWTGAARLHRPPVRSAEPAAAAIAARNGGAGQGCLQARGIALAWRAAAERLLGRAAHLSCGGQGRRVRLRPGLEQLANRTHRCLS